MGQMLINAANGGIELPVQEPGDVAFLEGALRDAVKVGEPLGGIVEGGREGGRGVSLGGAGRALHIIFYLENLSSFVCEFD